MIDCKNIILFFFLLFLTAGNLYAQEATENIDNATTYLDSRTQSLDKYISKSNGIQQRLLKRLQRKEKKMLKALAAKDSALYYDYIHQNLTYDSIAKLSNDTAYQQSLADKKNSTIDSLKGVQHFIENQQRASTSSATGGIASTSSATGGIASTGSATGGMASTSSAITGVASTGSATVAGSVIEPVEMPKGIPVPKDLSNMQQQLNVQQNVDNLIQQKTQSLKSFASQHTDVLRQSSGTIKGLEGIQKDVYYAREKIKNWKELTDDPDEAEAKALEYLQGTEGFDKFLKQKNNAFGGLGNDATAEDLQRMGYQTKASVNAMLQKSLGNNMNAVQQQMGQQVQQYTDQLNGITKKVDEVKNGVGQAKQGVKELQDTKNNLTKIDKPDFAKNPEKGKPFRERLEWQYNFQTSRAGIDGLKPAMMDIGMNLGYKQNERLSFGIGIGSTIGLGQNWQHVKLSYEGISARVYTDWKWVYGFSFQAGYERAFRPSGKAYLENTKSQNINPNSQNTNPQTDASDNLLKDAFGGQQQTAYIGIMKRYKINSKWSGTFLAGYNFLWQQEGMRTPWLLRFGWGK